MNPKEKNTIIKDIAKGISREDVAKKLGRHVRTVVRYLENPAPRKPRSDKGVSKTVTARDRRRLMYNLRTKPGNTSKHIFEDSGLQNVPKTSRNRILKTVGKFKSPEKKPPLSPKHKEKRVEWARKYMKLDMKHVLFTDESRATLDGPDSWGKGWVFKGDKTHLMFRRQQGGGGLMIWAGIIDNTILGPVRVPEGVKLTSKTYCELMESVLLPWLQDLPLSRRRKLIFMQDNAPSHSAKATKTFLSSLSIKGDSLMDWPACSPDLNPIENYWSILKQQIYARGRQFSSKVELWEAVKDAAASVSPSQIRKLTQSTNDRLFEVIRREGSYVGT